MTLYLGVFALVLLIALSLFLMPVLGSRKQAAAQQKDVNVELYRQRLHELESEAEEGTLDRKQFDDAKLELQRNLLSDTDKATSAQGNSGKLGLFAGLVLLTLVSVGGYIKYGGWQQVQNWELAVSQLSELGRRAVLNQGDPLTAQELRNFALGLRTKLDKDPNDAVAWLLLGRIAMSLNDIDMASEAFVRSLAIEPERKGTLISYSQALVLRGDDASLLKAESLLRKALLQDPEDIDALSLFALVNTTRQEWQKAGSAWKIILTLLEPEDPRYAAAEQKFRETQAKLNGKSVELEVEVALSEEARNSLSDSDILVVFAKAVNGPPMPVAVKRMQVSQFPVTLTLSDNDSLMPTAKLSEQTLVTLTARLSKDQDVAAAPGEWQGQSSQSVDLSKDTNIQLVIDRQVK